jgi:hypothetical protein
MDVAGLKQAAPLRTVWEHVVGDWPAQGAKTLCPLHEDERPSCHLYESLGRWWCFVCDRGGDVIDLVQAVMDSDFTSAVEYLTTELDLDPSLVRRWSEARQRSESPAEVFRRVSAQAHAEVVEYLRSTFPDASPALWLRLERQTFHAYDELLRQIRQGDLNVERGQFLLLTWWSWATGRATLPGRVIELFGVVGDPRNRDEQEQAAGDRGGGASDSPGGRARPPAATTRGRRVRGRR